MSQHDDAVTLRQMLNHAEEIRELLRAKRRSSLDKNRVLALAIIRLLEVLGEAANRVSPDVKRRNPGIPWLQIVGLRNRLIHAYDVVDLDVLWLIVKHDLPRLIRELEKITPPRP